MKNRAYDHTFNPLPFLKRNYFVLERELASICTNEFLRFYYSYYVLLEFRGQMLILINRHNANMTSITLTSVHCPLFHFPVYIVYCHKITCDLLRSFVQHLYLLTFGICIYFCQFIRIKCQQHIGSWHDVRLWQSMTGQVRRQNRTIGRPTGITNFSTRTLVLQVPYQSTIHNINRPVNL